MASSHTKYFEVKHCRPHLERLRHLLAETLYKGTENEVDLNDETEGNITKRKDVVCYLGKN